MGLRRMYACSSRLMTVTFIFLPVLITAMKLESRDFKTVDLTDYGGKQFMSDNGEPFYQILNEIGDDVYIGGNESLVRVYLDDNNQLQTTTVKLVTTNATNQLALSCSVLYGADNDTFCWNFIRLAEELSREPNKLLVCGTNANDRLCYRCNTTDLLDITCTPGPTPQLNVVPKLPTLRPSAAVFGPEGSSGTDDVLFAALVGDPNPTLQKFKVPLSRDPVFQLDTVTTGGRFIKEEAVFVGRPFEYTDSRTGLTYVFNFYREPAKEYESHGSKIYSRLSRVCKDDPGDSSSSNKMATFIKARVNCSLPNLLLPYHYDLIQDVFWDNETEEVYAVFTSQENGPAASALCRYRMSDIMKLFDEGKFKNQAGYDPNKLWLPVSPDPSPRPGTCGSTHPITYPPLLDELVPNYNPIEPSAYVNMALLITSALPTLYVDGLRFTSLAVDSPGDSCVFFFGTTTGSFLKAYKNNCSSETEKFKAIQFNTLGTDKSINGLRVLGDAGNKVLVVSESSELLDFPLENCSLARIEYECVYVYGPYCNWINGSCGGESGSSGGGGGGEDDITEMVLVQPNQSSIEACGLDKLVLYCEANYGPLNTESFTVNWTKTSDPNFIENNNYLVSLRQLSPSLLEMEVTVIKNASDGVYRCSSTLGTTVLEKTVDIKYIEVGCLTVHAVEERCDLHSQLEKESSKIKEDYNNQKSCSIDVMTCDTCPYGSTP